MPFFVRPRSNGKTFELRVKHNRLPKPIYHTFDAKEDAERAGQRAIAALDRGETPSWLVRSERRAFVTISQAIVAYRGIRAVPSSTQLLLDTLMNDVGTRPLSDVNYDWAEVWIRAMKLEKQLAPGTIRKRKGALSDVFDWVVRAHPMCLGANPLDQLPHGYSGYDEYTRQALAEQGVDIPGDVERNRRIDWGEESRIVRSATAAPGSLSDPRRASRSRGAESDVSARAEDGNAAPRDLYAAVGSNPAGGQNDLPEQVEERRPEAGTAE